MRGEFPVFEQLLEQISHGRLLALGEESEPVLAKYFVAPVSREVQEERIHVFDSAVRVESQHDEIDRFKERA